MLVTCYRMRGFLSAGLKSKIRFQMGKVKDACLNAGASAVIFYMDFT